MRWWQIRKRDQDVERELESDLPVFRLSAQSRQIRYVPLRRYNCARHGLSLSPQARPSDDRRSLHR
jgi:hypothetical protein